jgi:hypothetical protein
MVVRALTDFKFFFTALTGLKKYFGQSKNGAIWLSIEEDTAT